MNFENIKKLMDTDSMEDQNIPMMVKELKESNMPIQKIRKTMKSEIITQLICIVVFFIAPLFMKMHTLPKSVYYIFMFITCLITLGYLAKMTWFLKKTSRLTKQSKEVVMHFIFDLKLTLEVYKTAIIAGSLLLPFSMAALLLGAKTNKEDFFTNLFLINISTPTLLLYIFGYLLIALLIYGITIGWTNTLYGKHIQKLEEVLEQFKV